MWQRDCAVSQSALAGLAESSLAVVDRLSVERWGECIVLSPFARVCLLLSLSVCLSVCLPSTERARTASAGQSFCGASAWRARPLAALRRPPLWPAICPQVQLYRCAQRLQHFRTAALSSLSPLSISLPPLDTDFTRPVLVLSSRRCNGSGQGFRRVRRPPTAHCLRIASPLTGGLAG